MLLHPNIPITPSRLQAYLALIATGLGASVASRLVGIVSYR